MEANVHLPLAPILLVNQQNIKYLGVAIFCYCLIILRAFPYQTFGYSGILGIDLEE
jgi:hypothetical protein